VQLIIRSGSLASERHETASNGAGPQPPRADAAPASRAAPAPCAEVFVLDMGEPVRILELARAMIELSGLDPERDIEVEVVGGARGRSCTRAVQQLRACAADERREDPAGRS